MSTTSTASSSKDVIYIDIDDEITAIIDKVSSSPGKIVALVLPKRSSTLQSVVNMKLLQKSTVASKKNMVLITADQNLLPIAGAVGVYVAKNLQSKPFVPADPSGALGAAVDDKDVDTATSDPVVSAGAAVAIGALATQQEENKDETIDLDDEDISEDDLEEVDKVEKGKKNDKKNQQKVPNFTRFRKWLIIGGVAAIVLVVGAFFAFVKMPYANITIAAETKEVPVNTDVLFDASATVVTVSPAVVPSVVDRLERSNSETVAASGERNDGVKATGEVTMSLCTSNPGEVQNVLAGTGVSTSGKNYITQKNAVFQFNGGCGSGKFKFSTGTVAIVAQAAGSSYNVADATFTVAGSSAMATGSAAGGTDDVKKIVSQADIDSATKKIESKSDDSVKQELIKTLQGKNLYAIDESYVATKQAVTTNVAVGTVANDVTVTQKTSYSMVGAKETDINQLITKKAEAEIDTKNQKVLSTGLSEAVFKLQNQQDNSAKTLMSMSVKATVGTQFNDEQIKKDVAGMKAAQAEALIGAYPGVTKVEVTYGPFWVSSIPKNTDKITIVHEK